MLKLLAKFDEVLKSHLENPRLKNSTYISPQSQNDMIDVIGKLMIQSKILEEIVLATFYSILADEVIYHNTELKLICIRFVDGESNIREEFIQFIELKRITREYIRKIITDTLEFTLGLDCNGLVGQGYDGAANMSSAAVGIQAVVKRKAPKALYTHCYS